MKKAIVGYTGFVGSNLVLSTDFDGLYNTKNIKDAFGTRPDLLIYSGVRAEKFIANQEPEKDYAIIQNAIENIKKINSKTLVLISTIDVYKTPIKVNEDTVIDTDNLHPYGLNRYLLEKWVEENVDNYLIVRLPGLYGKNIKKNFIFDLIHVIPSMLNEAKYAELFAVDSIIGEYYIIQDNGFYQCKELTESTRAELMSFFNEIGFSAVNFTDSRGIFQFYNLAYLWGHIQKALESNIRKLNLATEPIAINDLYYHIRGKVFINEVSEMPPKYDFRTKHSGLFGAVNGYIYKNDFVIDDIKKFIVNEERK